MNVTVNPFRNAWVFVRLNWRIIALCMLAAVIVAAVTRYDHNRGRFMLVPASGDYPPYVLDTHTGQFCDAWPKGFKSMGIPYCVDLAKNWR
jgi:hypothetical protein